MQKEGLEKKSLVRELFQLSRWEMIKMDQGWLQAGKNGMCKTTKKEKQ